MKPFEVTASALILRSLPLAQQDTDTGKRLIKDQKVVVFGKSYDEKWLYVDAPAGRGWASAAYLEETEAPAIVMPSPSWPSVPRGYDEIVRKFGQPSTQACAAGRVTLPAPLKLSWANQQITVFACHKLMEDVFESVFNQIMARGLWPLIKEFGGCYAPRPVRGGGKVSTHAWGIGIDLNPTEYPLGSTKKQDRTLNAIFLDHGFINGEIWSRPDPMHWQYAKDY